MPRAWHDRHSANKIDDENTRIFYRSIVADKKPYFMRYIYPPLMKQYNTYIKNTNRNSLREFQLTIDELLALDNSVISERQEEFIKYYRQRMPVGEGDCVMNRICRIFENEFDGYIGRHNSSTQFDYQIMKSGSEYTRTQYDAISRLYEEYSKRLRNYAIFADSEHVDDGDIANEITAMDYEFRKGCDIVCQDEKVLCDIILDICYTRGKTKRFAWNMCGKTIISNLLANNNSTISFPTIDANGCIEYCGNRFSIESIMLEVC